MHDNIRKQILLTYLDIINAATKTVGPFVNCNYDTDVCVYLRERARRRGAAETARFSWRQERSSGCKFPTRRATLFILVEMDGGVVFSSTVLGMGPIS